MTDSISNENEKKLEKSDLQQSFMELRTAYQQKGGLPLKERKKLLKALKKAITSRKNEFVEAIRTDFRGRSSHETIGAEIFTLVTSIKHTLYYLDDWVEASEKEVSWVFWPAYLEVRPQPVGVVGIISPWNYPMSLALIPLASAIAAGNRALIKPSEHTPQTSALLQTVVAEVFPKDVVQVVQGEVEVAVAFSKLPFDHLFFTGSTEVGKKVMAAASSNLTPVTLELGGKSPAIIHSSFSLKTAASRIASGKFINAGQTCIAPDYVLCPADKVDQFVEISKSIIESMFKDLKSNDDYTSIINERQRLRLLSYIEDAKEKGASITEINPSQEELENKLPPTLITNVNDDMKIMQDEIFGPLLPIVPYKDLEEAIAYVNNRHRPLALYYFDHRSKRVKEVLNRTVSGGVCINDTLFHISQEELPFGGVGHSGMGAYHGKAGFDTFSHQKSVFHQSRFSLTPMLARPPYSKVVRFLMKMLTWR